MPNGNGNFGIQPPTFAGNNNNTSITEISNGPNQMTLYPNPSKGIVKIQVDQNSEQELTIINSIGQQVYNEKFIRKTEVDISILPSGFYVMQCGNMVRKLVVQR